MPPRSRLITPVCRLLAGVLVIALLGAGCTSSSPTGSAGGSGDAATTTTNLRPAAERQFQAFIDALDRGDAAAARAMYSTRQVEPELLLALTPAELHDFAAWLRTYQFGGVWGDRVEFRPTRHPPDQAVTSLYVHFASGTEGIKY